MSIQLPVPGYLRLRVSSPSPLVFRFHRSFCRRLQHVFGLLSSGSRLPLDWIPKSVTAFVRSQGSFGIKAPASIRITCRGLPFTAEAVSETGPASYPHRRIPRFIHLYLTSPPFHVSNVRIRRRNRFKRDQVLMINTRGNKPFPPVPVSTSPVFRPVRFYRRACFQSLITYFFNVPAR